MTLPLVTCWGSSRLNPVAPARTFHSIAMSTSGTLMSPAA